MHYGICAKRLFVITLYDLKWEKMCTECWIKPLKSYPTGSMSPAWSTTLLSAFCPF